MAVFALVQGGGYRWKTFPCVHRCLLAFPIKTGHCITTSERMEKWKCTWDLRVELPCDFVGCYIIKVYASVKPNPKFNFFRRLRLLQLLYKDQAKARTSVFCRANWSGILVNSDFTSKETPEESVEDYIDECESSIFQVLLCEISHDAIWYVPLLHCRHVLDRWSSFLFRCYCCVHVVFEYSLELSL